MKKIFILCVVVLFTFTASALAQKGVKKSNSAVLQSRVDSLSYALGQNMTSGLRQHLAGVGVLKDTMAASLIENYDAKFNDADDAGKATLQKEHEKKLKEVKKGNEKSFGLFINGLQDALLASSSENNSYNAGIGVGNQLSTIGERFQTEMLGGEKLNKELFVNAIVSALNDEKSLMENSEDYLQAAAMEMQQAAELKQAEELKELHGNSISEGVKFLAENKTKEGVVTLPSGLQYKILDEGTGVRPQSTDQVKVHYEGKLLDGTVFDSSYQRGEPLVLGVTQVIPGWIEALQLMPEGSKWTIYVPYDLGYGSRDQGTIKPYSTLIFDIELIEVVK